MEYKHRQSPIKLIWYQSQLRSPTLSQPPPAADSIVASSLTPSSGASRIPSPVPPSTTDPIMGATHLVWTPPVPLQFGLNVAGLCSSSHIVLGKLTFSNLHDNYCCMRTLHKVIFLGNPFFQSEHRYKMNWNLSVCPKFHEMPPDLSSSIWHYLTRYTMQTKYSSHI